jgi:DNA-binding SARP family transcriptional activator
VRALAFRLLSLLVAAMSLGGFALLWRFRPAWPELPESLSSPVTTAVLQQLALIAAWFLTALVLLLLLARSIRALFARDWRPPPQALNSGSMLTRRSVSRGRARVAVASAEPAFAPPFALIPRPEPRIEGQYTPVRAATTRNDPLPAIALLGPLKIAATKPRRRRLRSQTQELLVYLAFHKEGATTDELVALLWPDVDIDNARARVHRAVSEVRSQLGKVIVRAGERYVLDRNAVALDLDKFEAVLARADARRDGDREQFLEKALAYVRGEPLEGTDYPWAAGDVRHLRAKVVELLHDLGDLRLGKNNATGALAAAERALALDSYNESAHRLAMRAESALRLREAIAARYERLSQELDAQFGLEPERETRLLYRRLLGQDVGTASAAT